MNGKKRTIYVDTTKGKFLVGQTVAKMVMNGKFKDDALSETEDANGGMPHIVSDKVTIRANDILDSFPDIVQTLQCKTPAGVVKSFTEVVEVLGRLASARGKPFPYVQIDSHGGPNGYLYFVGGTIHASEMIKNLMEAGAIKKGSTIEFFSCLIGQDFKGMQVAAKKYGVNIKAANYLQNRYGVAGAGFNGFLDKIDPFGSTEKIYPKVRVLVQPAILTFTPSGKVFQPDGKQITKIEYKN